jgi:hypothetical protein
LRSRLCSSKCRNRLEKRHWSALLAKRAVRHHRG